MIVQAIDKLLSQEDLTREEASESFNEIMSGEATDAQIAAFLMGLAIKGETPEEIAECARIMREKSIVIEPNEDVLEIVGTGGDRFGTFNISTTSALLSAAAGIPVAKHGNRSVSSKSGSADVLDALGIKIDLDKEANEKVLDEANFCFMFAPVYHQAMRYVSPIRKQLAIPTIFNILGPLANPARATIQLLGVYSEDLVLPLAKALKDLGIKRGMVVHGNDGMDEVTLTGPTKAALISEDGIEELVIDPTDYGFEICNIEELIGGDGTENAQIALDIFNGKKGPMRDAVVLNTAVAMFLANKVDSIDEGVKLANELIDSGKALEKLNELIEVTNRV